MIVTGTGDVTTKILDTGVKTYCGPTLDTATWCLVGTNCVNEGATASYKLTLSGVLQAGETAFIRLRLTDITTSSADYASFTAAVLAAIGSRTDLSFNASTGVLTFTSSGTTMAPLVIQLGTIIDTDVEGTERLLLESAIWQHHRRQHCWKRFRVDLCQGRHEATGLRDDGYDRVLAEQEWTGTHQVCAGQFSARQLPRRSHAEYVQWPRWQEQRVCGQLLQCCLLHHRTKAGSSGDVTRSECLLHQSPRRSLVSRAMTS